MSDLSKIIGRDFDKKKEIPQVKLDFSKLDLSGVDKFTKDIFSDLEEISKDIVRKQDNAKAMEFTKVVGTMLRENGVTPIIAEYKRNFVNENSFETRYGFGIERLDFTEHDKVFEDKIEELKKLVDDYHSSERELFDEKNSLKQRIAELEAELESKKTTDLPFDPMETANYLINATYERETNGIERSFAKLPDKISEDKYSIDDLEQIAEHLLIYCKHNKEV